MYSQIHYGNDVFTNTLWDFGEVEQNPKLKTRIILTSDEKVIQKRRRINFNQKEKVRDILKNHLEKGVLRKSVPPHTHVCNMVIVEEEGKELPRICFDYTDLNFPFAREHMDSTYDFC